MDNTDGQGEDHVEITWINPILLFLLAIFSLLITIFIVLLLGLIINSIVQYIKTKLAYKRMLEKMEIYTGKSGSCIICYDDFLHTKVAKLSCGHSYHKDCVLEWFERKRICPLCRFQV